MEESAYIELVEKEFRHFIDRHFEAPESCLNMHQLKFYLSEIDYHIERYKQKYNYVPGLAYNLRDQYEKEQDRMKTRNTRVDILINESVK
ncbi:MAG: hypothetical protein OEX02_20255 [Cyclobacteriaceae bacterium]|nr:hypothetical protein [Cyclobacteriaceae bacterium]